MYVSNAAELQHLTSHTHINVSNAFITQEYFIFVCFNTRCPLTP